MTFDLNSPVTAQELRRIIESQVDRRLAETQPRHAYGTVTAINSATQKATVALYGEVTGTPGFFYPLHEEPEVGERVRVVMHGADRYIEANLSMLGTRRHQYIGGRVFKSSTLTMTSVSAWTLITGFDDVLDFYRATWNDSGIGAIKTTEPGLYYVNLTGRFINATSGQRYGLGVYSNNTGTSYAGTSPPNQQVVLSSAAVSANHYTMVSTVIGTADATRYWYPVYWQSSSSAHNIDSVLFTVMKITDDPD